MFYNNKNLLKLTNSNQNLIKNVILKLKKLKKVGFYGYVTQKSWVFMGTYWVLNPKKVGFYGFGLGIGYHTQYLPKNPIIFGFLCLDISSTITVTVPINKTAVFYNFCCFENVKVMLYFCCMKLLNHWTVNVESHNLPLQKKLLSRKRYVSISVIYI